MNYTQLLEDVKLYVLRFFRAHDKPEIVYHNQAHTEHVVRVATEIAAYYNLDDHDSFVVITAAWFHDTGYYTGAAQGHEQRASEMLSLFLKERSVDESTIQAIQGCVMATRLPQAPNNLLEQIVCDADLSHLGSDEFSEKNKLLRKEVERINHKDIPKDEWRKGTIRFLESTHYHSAYAQQLFNEKKQQNLDKLKLKLLEHGEELPKQSAAPATTGSTPSKKENTSSKKTKPDRPERGIETMFRISSANHQRLSDMADNKAHIMITTTSIILSVLLSVLLRKLEDNPYLIIPTLLLLVVCVVTMVFSILATRPTIPPGKFTQQDITDKKVNLLFFGNFYRMNYDEYSNGMNTMMNDREFLYGSLTRDVYSQGVVLGRKYRLLRIAYNVFMYGIVASVVAFTIATIFFAH